MAIDRNCVGINGKKLRQARVEAGYKIKDLSKKTGMTESAISQIENEKMSPGIRTARLMAVELNVSLDWLCDVVTPFNNIKIADIYNTLNNKNKGLLLEIAKMISWWGI